METDVPRIAGSFCWFGPRAGARLPAALSSAARPWREWFYGEVMTSAKTWRQRLRSWRRWILIVICAVLLAVAIKAEESMVAKSFRSFGHLHLRPLIFAVVMEVLSMVALGLMERRILIMGGLRIPVRRSIAIASNAVFVVIICIGGIFSENVTGIAAGAAGIVLTILVVWLAAVAVRRPGIQERLIRASVWILTRSQRTIRRPAGDPAGLVASSVSGLGSFAPHRPDVLRTVYSALRNWAFDLLCLTFSIKAAGVRVPWWGIVLAWAAGAGGSSISLTPGRPRRGRGRADRRAGRAGRPGRARPDRRADLPGHHVLAGRRHRLGRVPVPAAPTATGRRARGHRHPGSGGQDLARQIQLAQIQLAPSSQCMMPATLASVLLSRISFSPA
jgi:uncharacterized membrane protein YbhN (UPF0104 family)